MPDTYSTDPYVLALARRLRAAREKTGLNANGAGYLMGMGRGRVSALETGRTEPKAQDVALWARLTGADPGWLLYGEDLVNREPIPILDDPKLYAQSPGAEARARSVERNRAEKPRGTPPRRGKRTEQPLWRPESWGHQ